METTVVDGTAACTSLREMQRSRASDRQQAAHHSTLSCNGRAARDGNVQRLVDCAHEEGDKVYKS